MNRLRLLVIGFLLVSIGVLADEAPTMILYNGIIVPMTTQADRAAAIAIASNRILSIGSTLEMLALARPTTQLIDLQGAAVYPGFIDPHTHLLNDSQNLGLSPIESQNLALRYGITSAANMYTTPSLAQEYIEMAQRGELRVRFSLYLVYNTSCGDVLGDWYAQYDPLVELAPRLRIGGVKIFSETSVCGDDLIGISFSPQLRSVLSPAGTQWYGPHRPLFTQDELSQIIHLADERGFPVAIHALGDGGVELSLHAIEQALEGKPNTLRHTILHNLFIRDDLLNRYAALGIVAAVESMSSCFATFYQDLLPLESKHIVRRWGDLAATGAHVTADSDWPWCADEAINPLFRLQALMSPANHSQSYGAWEPCGLLPESQLLTAWQGLRMMTADAAFMLHQDHELGTLEPSKLADMVILTADPLQSSVEALDDIDVLLTFVGGVIEYDREADL
ncbi:amidohydrolase family protein [Candidatus Bipolaricaulota bacterium]|nr:amidohydrolase family protein [Candidatus Bipolaricaulota bacterium]